MNIYDIIGSTGIGHGTRKRTKILIIGAEDRKIS